MLVKGEQLAKKKPFLKLKKSRSEEKVVLEPIEIGIQNTLSKYVNLEFNDVKEQIEQDLQELFKKYDNLEYKGYITYLGMIDDIIVLFKTK